jgi:hypothetical protein
MFLSVCVQINSACILVKELQQPEDRYYLNGILRNVIIIHIILRIADDRDNIQGMCYVLVLSVI